MASGITVSRADFLDKRAARAILELYMETISKKQRLELLAREMADNASLPLVGQANLVFGEGNPDCEVLFIGEAPGENEDIQKRPFVGRGGQLLRENIRAIGWKEEDVYITNIVKRRPPANRDPYPEEIEAYKPYLTRQIEIINPKIIVPLGRFAMNYFLPEAKITRDQGRAFRVALSSELPTPNPEPQTTNPIYTLIVPILHPAAALRGNEAMRQFRESFTKLPAIVDKGGVTHELPEARPTVKEKKSKSQAELF
jgi:DNA polymerase